MDDVTSFFKETQETFTIYVVEQRFAVGRGLDYFKSFIGKVNFIESNAIIKRRIHKILKWIQKNVPNISELISSCFSFSSSTSIVDIITSLNKIFSVQEHQAAGPEVIDPIIIQEGNILPKYVTQLVTLHEKSILQPVIIILLKDNNFDRAKELLSNCPHGINIKFIRNSGETNIYKVINSGASNIDMFIDAFSQQCFSTCSHTSRNILLNEEWSQNSIIKTYCPSILKIRTNLICDEKEGIQTELSELINLICSIDTRTENEKKLKNALECTTLLMRVFCNDYGGQDIEAAYKLAQKLENDLLLAHVYRYADFFTNISQDGKKELLETAEKIFSQNKMEDHSIYCKNNRLVHQFQEAKINPRDFREMQGEALYNVPGLVGMSHILNNTGTAFLMTGNPEEAIKYFNKSLDYSKRHERSVQKLATTCNYLIARSYCFEEIEFTELKRTLNLIFDNLGMDRLPFISMRFAMNIIALAYKQSSDIGNELLEDYPVIELVKKGLSSNNLGSGEILLQINYLVNKYNIFNGLDLQNRCINIKRVEGSHKQYIEKYGLNPFIFCTWL